MDNAPQDDAHILYIVGCIINNILLIFIIYYKVNYINLISKTLQMYNYINLYLFYKSRILIVLFSHHHKSIYKMVYFLYLNI